MCLDYLDGNLQTSHSMSSQYYLPETTLTKLLYDLVLVEGRVGIEFLTFTIYNKKEPCEAYSEAPSLINSRSGSMNSTPSGLKRRRLLNPFSNF